MTLEEIKMKMNTLNEDLDAVIIAPHFDETKWEEYTSELIKKVMEDESVKKILLEGIPEVRKEYLEVIRAGIEKGLQKLREKSKELHDSGMIDKENSFNNVALQAEKLEDTVLTIEAIDDNASEFVYTNKERIEDLEKKIYYIDSTIEMKSKFEQLEKEIPVEKDENIEEKSIKLAKEIQKEFTDFERDLKMINQLRTSQNAFMKLLQEMRELSLESKIDMTNEEQKAKVKEMVRLAGLIDKVDYLDPRDPNKVKLSKPQYEDKNGKAIDPNIAVDTWLGTINAKLDVDAKAKKLNMDPDFLDSRERIIRERFIDSYRDSTVHKILTPQMHQKVLEDKDFEIQTLKNSITDLTERLKKYKFLSKKNPDELLEYKKEAEKLLSSYKIIADGAQTITINGKVKQLQTDLTDISNKYDAVDEILELDNDDEFKKEIESKAIVLAGEKPTDRWYHKLARFVTFGMYKTPEQKYGIKLYGKKAEIVEDLIKENKQKIKKATQDVEYDKNAYKYTARKKAYEERDKKPEEKKFDKKQVMKKREKSQPLTR